jgi:hypothetical protein
MVALFGEKVALLQENGPEIELRAYGDEFYARYETDDGYTAIYDAGRGLFVYARLDDGALVSTGVPVIERAPAGLDQRLVERPDVRASKEAARRSAMGVDADR